jgi:cytoskeleton protein RodZ
MLETRLPSFGEKLKQEREKRKITLEQISVTTKIGTRMLQALEEDKFNQLPGGIFNKGFVRAYSRAVGLDEDQTVADYLAASGDLPAVPTEIAPREDNIRDNARENARENAERVSRIEAANASTRQLPWGLFAAVLLVIALALSLWSHRRQETARKTFRPAPTTTAEKQGASSLAAGQISTGDMGSGSANSEAPPTAPTVAQGSVPAAPAADEITVVIQTREESWVSATVDGKTSPSETLDPESERIFRGHREIVIKIGNAGGVDVRFNGKKIDVAAESGEVKTIAFGPHGVLANSPSTP